MYDVDRGRRFGLVFLLLAITLGRGSASAQQVIMAGEWVSRYQEDQPERIPGPALGDYLGLPITDGARLYALSWDPNRLSVPEHQCRVHTAPYIYRGPMQFRVWEDKDPVTQAVTAIRHYISTYEQNRTIWMDGRPHPPEYALHYWAGVSTGTWTGDMLTVTTTHIKQNWHRRNGLPQSDRAELTEHFILHGDVLTRISFTTDPVYLTEPLVKSENFVRQERSEGNWLWPCDVVEESARPKTEVPHYLPGQNPYLAEIANKYGLPVEVTMGGAEQMYPEYRATLKALLAKSRAAAAQ